MSARRLRVAAVGFTNARPLLDGLEREPDVELRLVTPARAADLLEDGDVDVGLIPAVEMLRRPELMQVTSGVVAADGPSRTTLLASPCPFEQILAIRCSAASRSTNALARVIVSAHAPQRAVQWLSPTDSATRADLPPERIATVVIGDAAFAAGRDAPWSYDLGAAWRELTGLPFVFACFAARAPLGPRAQGVLDRARQRGTASLDRIAQDAALELGESEALMQRYFQRLLHYEMTEQDRLGLAHFAGLLGLPAARARRAIGFSPRNPAAPAPRPRLRTAAPPEVRVMRATMTTALPDEASASEVTAALGQAMAGMRLDAAGALALAERGPLPALLWAAREARQRARPGRDVSYIVNANVNYTNVCVTRCGFCAFYRVPGDDEGYLLDAAEIVRRVQAAEAHGATQVLLQGGHHPKLGLAYFESVLRALRDRTSVHVHALSAPEIAFYAGRWGLSVEAVIERLVAAGLQTIPGGGAEVLSESVRGAISPLKCTVREWLAVHEAAHRLGVRTSATMMFGTAADGWPERIEHLERLRALQDRTGGFTAFIAWTYQPIADVLAERERSRSAAAHGGAVRPVATRPAVVPTAAGDRSPHAYLRMVALARLYLDNVATIQASPLTQPAGVTQLALDGGADDLGNVLLEEHVVQEAGVKPWLTEAGGRALIAEAGYLPRRRDTWYRLVDAVSAPREVA